MIPDDPSVASYAHRPANTHAFARTLAKLPREVTDVPDASRRTSPATFARSTSTRGGPTRPTASAAPSASSRGRGEEEGEGGERGGGGGAARGGAASGSSALGSGSRAVPGVVVGRGGRRARASTRAQSTRVAPRAELAAGTSASPSPSTSTLRTRHTYRRSASIASGRPRGGARGREPDLLFPGASSLTAPFPASPAETSAMTSRLLCGEPAGDSPPASPTFPRSSSPAPISSDGGTRGRTARRAPNAEDDDDTVWHPTNEVLAIDTREFRTSLRLLDLVRSVDSLQVRPHSDTEKCSLQ